jgi:mRNA-degrading endonuclease RelE of RelBE toxin-antitoxin system
VSDKIQKFLAKLSKKDYEVVSDLIKQISLGEIKNLDCKPLKGHADMFRVRKGRIRIIFYRDVSDSVRFYHIGNRDEKTYRNF